jgi:hypothetical protein
MKSKPKQKVVRLLACPHCKRGVWRGRFLGVGYLHVENGKVLGWCHNP